MTREVFVTGMLRSGTTLLQTLLTNHPRLFIAYQPFHQLYVDVKQTFLDEMGWERLLPLGDDADSEEDQERFAAWLADRQFDRAEIDRLVARAVTGKGGGASDLRISAPADCTAFLPIRKHLHDCISAAFPGLGKRRSGSKEVLCEEYVPTLAGAGIHCFLILRDPRAVVASASHGRYREMVGDRYPLLMLIRLWRKSAKAWLAMVRHPMVTTIRYEDLVTTPNSVLDRISTALSISGFPDDLLSSPLLDHRGEPWKGNSSFGDKENVESSGNQAWMTLLSEAEIAFIEACTQPEMAAVGYRPLTLPSRRSISGFVEDTSNVREVYLRSYMIEGANRELELKRWDARDASA